MTALASRVRWDGTRLGLAVFDALTDDELVRLGTLIRLARGARWRVELSEGGP